MLYRLIVTGLDWQRQNFHDAVLAAESIVLAHFPRPSYLLYADSNTAGEWNNAHWGLCRPDRELMCEIHNEFLSSYSFDLGNTTEFLPKVFSKIQALYPDLRFYWDSIFAYDDSTEYEGEEEGEVIFVDQRES